MRSRPYVAFMLLTFPLHFPYLLVKHGWSEWGRFVVPTLKPSLKYVLFGTNPFNPQ